MNTTTFASLVLVVLSSVAGCGVPVAGESPTHEDAMCAPRSGTYSAHYVERAGGTCGPKADTTFGIDPNLPDVATTCVGHAFYTPDKCIETFDLTCPTGMAAGGTLRNIGYTEWALDASSGHSAFDYIYADDNGNVTCRSTYDISYVRL